MSLSSQHSQQPEAGGAWAGHRQHLLGTLEVTFQQRLEGGERDGQAALWLLLGGGGLFDALS